MKVGYVTSSIGVEPELHISSAKYKRVNSENKWSDNVHLICIVHSYIQANQSANSIRSRDLKEELWHRKRVENVALAIKAAGEITWCDADSITGAEIIPVITSNDGSHFPISYSSKTNRQMNRTRQEREVDPYE